MSIEELDQEDIALGLQFEELEEYYAIHRCYPPSEDRHGRSHFGYMVGTDLIYLASFVRHLDRTLSTRTDRRGV